MMITYLTGRLQREIPLTCLLGAQHYGNNSSNDTMSLLKYPARTQQLLAKMRDAVDKSMMSDTTSWSQAIDLPSLNACIKEVRRSQPLSRSQLGGVVPAQGAEICGQHFEGATVVGISD